MQKTITYLYPDMEKADSFKVYQDRNNQIKAFGFRKRDIGEIRDLDCALNSAVYILFSTKEKQKVFVGKTLSGVDGVSEVLKGKDFLGNCIMFVDDSNSWGSISIDYLEYRIKSKVKDSTYKLIEADISTVEPKVNMFDASTLENYIEQIDVLLRAEGVYLNKNKLETEEDIEENSIEVGNEVVDAEVVYDETEVDDMKSDNARVYYYPKNKEYEASIYIHNKTIYLAKGSILRLPNGDMKNRKAYAKIKKVIDGLILDKKAMYVNGKIKTAVDIKFLAYTSVIEVIIGKLASGYNFFEGLREPEKTGNRNVKPTIKDYYYAKDGEFNAKVKLSGDKFVLIKGSEIRRPEEKTADYSTKYFYESNNKIVDKLIKSGSVKSKGEKFVVLKDLEFKSPSGISALVLGRSCNGWDFFDGLREIKAILKN